MNGKYRVEFNSKVADYIDSDMTAAEYVDAVQEDAAFFWRRWLRNAENRCNSRYL